MEVPLPSATLPNRLTILISFWFIHFFPKKKPKYIFLSVFIYYILISLFSHTEGIYSLLHGTFILNSISWKPLPITS